MARSNKSPVSPWISANSVMGPVPEEWQIWDRPGSAETGQCNKWTDFSYGSKFHLSWKQFFLLLLQTQGYCLLCFVHFKGWGWGLKGKHRNAAFKSLMYHIVPFKTSPCLCSLSPEEWRTASWNAVLDQLFFWILVLLYLWKFVFQMFTQLEGSELKADWHDMLKQFPPILEIEPSTWCARQLLCPGAIP